MRFTALLFFSRFRFLLGRIKLRNNGMKKEFQLTKEGVAELQAELADLKLKLVDVIESIKTARDQGDLSENAEYHAAKEEQERVDNRIAEINHILANTEIISKHSKTSVGIGCSVSLKNGGKPVTYHIVDSVEADPLEFKISDESPIGKALMGKKVGDKVEIKLPAGLKTYEVKEIA
jgi:transcription elongation factor GreA